MCVFTAVQCAEKHLDLIWSRSLLHVAVQLEEHRVKSRELSVSLSPEGAARFSLPEQILGQIYLLGTEETV